MVPCPVPGSLLATNSDAVLNPGVLSEQPYGDGWLVTLKLDDESATSKLLSSHDYEKHCSTHPQDPDPASLEDEEDPTKERGEGAGQEPTDDDEGERIAGPDGEEAKDDKS
uniref:Glycine cleavage system H protein n=2 Tax=Rhodosorus marinus TaxID=101924 RepID=A0A7S2ZNP4_9RHOD|mmetsp:Transcript_25548/g.100891  ORF Transcript_25548/g.100891 Transcript_25548/m.100891 type:complete len:111 (+) Transcript_25548:666-998(+)